MPNKISKSLSVISQTASEILMETTDFYMIQEVVADAFEIAKKHFKDVKFLFNGVEVQVPRDGSKTQEQVLAAYFNAIDFAAQSAANTSVHVNRGASPLLASPARVPSPTAPAPVEAAAPDVDKEELLTLLMATNDAMDATKIAIDSLERLRSRRYEQGERLHELKTKHARYALMHKKLSAAVKAFDQIAATGA